MASGWEPLQPCLSGQQQPRRKKCGNVRADSVTFYFPEIFLAEGKEEKKRRTKERKKLCLCVLQESRSKIRSLQILTPSKIRARTSARARPGKLLQTADFETLPPGKLTKSQLKIKTGKGKGWLMKNWRKQQTPSAANQITGIVQSGATSRLPHVAAEGEQRRRHETSKPLWKNIGQEVRKSGSRLQLCVCRLNIS